MAPDYLPRVSSLNCHYPFTFLGVVYHGCVENMENATSTCERWGCMQINYTAAVCAANIGRLRSKHTRIHRWGQEKLQFLCTIKTFGPYNGEDSALLS